MSTEDKYLNESWKFVQNMKICTEFQMKPFMKPFCLMLKN